MSSVQQVFCKKRLKKAKTHVLLGFYLKFHHNGRKRQNDNVTFEHSTQDVTHGSTSVSITVEVPLRTPTGSNVQPHQLTPPPLLTLSVLEVVAPQWPDFVLTAHVPHCEADVLVFYSFNIKTWAEDTDESV